MWSLTIWRRWETTISHSLTTIKLKLVGPKTFSYHSTHSFIINNFFSIFLLTMCLELDSCMAYDEQISYKRIKLNWIKLNGFYDNLNITRVLISTESRRFFTSVNYSEQENCKIGFKTMDIVSYVNASKEASFLYSDMCPMSSYNFTLTVNRKNFTSTTTYYQLTTSEYRHILIFIVLILRKKLEWKLYFYNK